MIMKDLKDKDTRERIRCSALREFAEHGFSGARIDRIAARSGANKAMIYYHFEGKEGLYFEILKMTYSGICEKFDDTNPDLEFLSINRRELFSAANDVLLDELKNVSSYEKFLYVCRVKDKLPFNEISKVAQTLSSSRDFEKILKKLKMAIVPRLNKAIDHFFG